MTRPLPPRPTPSTAHRRMVFGLMAAAAAILALTVSTRRAKAPAPPPAPPRLALAVGPAAPVDQPLDAAVAAALAGIEACQRAATEPLQAVQGAHGLHLRVGPGGLEGAAVSTDGGAAPAWPPGFAACAAAAVGASGWPAGEALELRAPFYVVAPLRERGAPGGEAPSGEAGAGPPGADSP